MLIDLLDLSFPNHKPKPSAALPLIGLCLFVLLSIGCSDSSNPPNTVDDPASFESTFAALQSKLFEGRGCTEAACHGSAAVGGLDLRAGTAYEQLLEVPSSGSALNRVEPGDRARSYLYLKLLAATDAENTEIAGSPMPSGGSAIPDNLLQALRLWIYAGAPKTGTVSGTAELLGAELPPEKPISIAKLAPPEPSEGFQLEMPQWLVPAGSEREVCFAAYYDLRDQVPDSMKDETGEYAFVSGEHLRQDPQSHHLIVRHSQVGVDDIHDPSFGGWTCRGGENDGDSCEPTDLNSCASGHCATEPKDGFACIGYGPSAKGGTGSFNNVVAGAQKAQDFGYLPEGVYEQVALRGVLYWNSHAFNVTDVDHWMNGRINLFFSKNPIHLKRRLSGTGALFKPKTPPFEREEVCHTTKALPQGAHLISLSSHTHKRGERFTIFHPDGSLLYENLIYNDPVRKNFDPPIVFDSDDAAERTLKYCGVFNNGVDEAGQPDIETVTRFSRLPDSTKIPGVPGTCKPIACVSGRIGEACDGKEDNVSCDSSPGAGDGWCDACPITGGESTENEMFLLIGSYYLLDNAE